MLFGMCWILDTVTWWRQCPEPDCPQSRVLLSSKFLLAVHSKQRRDSLGPPTHHLSIWTLSSGPVLSDRSIIWATYEIKNVRVIKKICIIIIIIFFYFWLCCVFVVVWAFLSCGELGLLSSCGAWASHCSDFSCWRAQSLGGEGLSSCDTWA